jgi:hypothetical protein
VSKAQQDIRRKIRALEHAARNTTAPVIVDQILHLRRTYHLGPIRIVWYLERYHDIRVCDATAHRTLKGTSG